MARAAAKREREAHWAWRAASVGQLERTLRWRSPRVAASLAQTRDALWAQQAAAHSLSRGPWPRPGPSPSPSPSSSSVPEAAGGVPHVNVRGRSIGLPLRQREPGAASGQAAAPVPSASAGGACAEADAEGARVPASHGGGSSRKVLSSEGLQSDLAVRHARTQADCSDGRVT